MAKNNRHHFLVVFLTGSFGILLVLSLIPRGLKPNLLGSPGSYLASALYACFGLWAWVFPLILFRLTVSRFQGGETSKLGLKILGVCLGLVSLCVLTEVFFHGSQMFPQSQMQEGFAWGGKLGVWMGGHMESVLTRFGTAVIGLMALILSIWLLGKEEHLVDYSKRTVDGTARGLEWFKDNGFEAFIEVREKISRSLSQWKARRGEKAIATAARRKLEAEQKPLVEKSSRSPQMASPAPQTVFPKAVPKSEKSLKPTSRGRVPFTGEAFEEAIPETVEEKNTLKEDEQDMVALAMAEAKGPDPMTLRQKMEAASIEMADEEEEKEPAKPVRILRQWQLPNVHILKSAEESKDKVLEDFEGVSRRIIETLANFGVEAKVVGVNPGPTVTQYEVQPAAGVKITRIASLADDLALALQCGHLRVVAPLPGKAAVGIEVPNLKGRIVTLKELIGQEEFLASGKKLLVVLGKDISGAASLASIKEMPHVLIAGSTGSGKSVCVNTLIASLIFKYTPEELRLVLIDPKRVEMSIYKGLPHLALPVVNDPKEAHFALKWLVREMEERYEALAHVGARDIDTYNTKILQRREAGETDSYPLYYIVVLVDELADLMMVAKDQVEDSITRLAQMARAVGIHLVLATQRPSVEVITGIIKANFPSRIAFQVFSKVDSRTILDMNGAEALVGRGDMLYLPSGAPKPLRLQGAYVTLEEIERLVDFWTSQGGPQYSADLAASKSTKDLGTDAPKDERYDEAVEIIIRAKRASTSLLQRRLEVGYSRAARILDEMELRGVIEPSDGTNKPRKVSSSYLATHDSSNVGSDSSGDEINDED